jgi:hypothetical protein
MSTYLKLRWARFFTLAGWDWNLAPKHQGFDFHVKFPCDHSECNGSHELLVRVVEKTHEALVRKHQELFDIHFMYASPHPALFGNGPKNTHWQMTHGAGGGDETVEKWTDQDANQLWERAAHE